MIIWLVASLLSILLEGTAAERLVPYVRQANLEGKARGVYLFSFTVSVSPFS